MRRAALIATCLLALLASLLAQMPTVDFSRQGGFYEESFSLTLTCDEGLKIRYTTNGNNPTGTSTLYESPLTLDEELYSRSRIYTIVNTIPSQFYEVEDVEHAIVIRAAAFDANDSCVGPVVTNTYFIKALGCDLHGLPALSIAADSLDMFDYETGIFVPGIHYDPADSIHTGNFHQTGREWERIVNVEFYEPNNQGINQICGLRTHGAASRFFQQKGMKLYAREEYGIKRFKHKFFESTPIESFKRLCLHPFRCSNWLQTGGQDYLAHRIASHLDIESLAVREVVVFINGEYWGIYTLEESPDQRYLEDHYDVDLEQVNMIKWWCVNHYGDISDWDDFYTWIREADLQNPADSAMAFSRVDMSSFIDYMIYGTFTANLDWPQNNVLIWQRASGEPFRFLFFDGDGCYTRWYYQALDNAIHQGGNSVVFKHFLENEYFRRRFCERYNELKETHFRYEAMKPYLEEYRNLVREEIPNQADRFGFPWHKWKWAADMDSTDMFLQRRSLAYEQELSGFMSVGETEIQPFACYPNPSSGAFLVMIHSNASVTLPVEIYDVMGRRIWVKERHLAEGSNMVDFNLELPSGLYLMKIGNNVQQIVIN